VSRFLAVVFVALLAGCAGGQSSSSPELSAAAVREAPARVRAGRTFAFEATYTRQVRGKPDESYLTLAGVVDVQAGSGRMEADLSALLAGPDSSGAFEEPVELSWTREQLTALVEGEERSSPRAQAREDGGLLGRLPDEPAALVDLLGEAEQVRRVGDERVDGHATVRFSCSVDARRAGATGVPAELAPAFEQALYGPRLPLEVWLDGDGLPRRIEYLIRLKPVSSGGKQVLPARAVRASFELSDFGADVVPSR
jgi:hypothetical protein